MGKKYDSITLEQKEFIKNQKIFFVGTAASEGSVNVSPKGTDSFRVINENKIVWLNLTGSGNETAAHLLKNNRMTIMFCAFEGNPLILRLYGNAKIYHKRDEEFYKYINMFPENNGSRQIIEMDINLVQTSCGFAVPFMDYKEERTTLISWAEKKARTELMSTGKRKIQKVLMDSTQKFLDRTKMPLMINQCRTKQRVYPICYVRCVTGDTCHTL